MNARFVVVLFSLFYFHSLMAYDLNLKVSTKVDFKYKTALEKALLEVDHLLPPKLKLGLPAGLELRIEKLSEHQSIPKNVCASKINKELPPFIYGKYNQRKNVLVLNLAVANELLREKSSSLVINCQHGTLYDQAIATIVHELTHAYDLNNSHPSQSEDYIFKAGFKKGLFKSKSKNIESARSVDTYELTSISENYAVNMEYFLMDSEFACRKPTIFEYFKRTMELDPYPNRSCQKNNIVMLTTASGRFPVKLDPARVYRIDYLLASPGKEASSGFGHSMFRVVVCAPERFDPIINKIIKETPFGPKCLEDKFYHLVVSYRANIEDATMNYVKGIFGGYPSVLFILSFADVLDEYNIDELRDVISYPLKLSAKERNDFINKVQEEHWGYRGSYKFFTNNCAVESFDLLKSSLESPEGARLHSVTPEGVLKDLDSLEFVSLKNKNEELFKAKTEQLIVSYKEAYQEKNSNYKAKPKKDKDLVLSFISKSSASFRLQEFARFSSHKLEKQDLHSEISSLKSLLVKASSFSVMEQQILRTKLSILRKKTAELLMSSKNEKIKKLVEENASLQTVNYSNVLSSGYGIPLADEVLNSTSVELKIEQSRSTIEALELLIKEFLPNEVEELELINSNITIFNKKSLEIRKLYREKLGSYIYQVLTNLALDDSSRILLKNAITSESDLDKIRELLDSKLISKKEITNLKLRTFINEVLN